ncbi:hypothetical protein KLP28_15835 [Nocardioidaceae bacterium]|nr:hypothetical protein KLP28_15835 [Nocardioidaceae bacterium]
MVRVAADRVARWCDNFVAAHGGTVWAVDDGCVTLQAADGSWAHLQAPFGREVPPEAAMSAGTAVQALAAACEPPPDWGVLLVRRGGFAVVRLSGREPRGRKVGQRHVQGRTKAGGQSQQRFARRRANQAIAAYEAAAGHAARILAPSDAPAVPLVVVGGDRAGIEAVLADPRLRTLGEAVVRDLLDVPDPTGKVLDAAVESACAVRVTVRNA